jgi:glycosyltransferase involved in cell wall biosynthesis
LKILHLYSGGARGGVQMMFRRTVLGLAAEDVQQTVVLGVTEDATPLTTAGIPVHTARFRNRFVDLATHWAVRRVIRTTRPDVIQVWPHRANWFVRGRSTPPVVRFLGGPPPLRRFRKFYADAAALLVPGPGTADALQQYGWPAAKTCVLRHFAPLAAAVPLPRPAGFLVAGVGRLSPEKGFDLLVAALGLCPDVQCWLVGDGPERGRLEAMAAATGRVSNQTAIPASAGMTAQGVMAASEKIRFLGWQADPAPAIAAVDAVVVPSREESFGLVILEAWAQGKPVIATDCDGPRALIADGETGLLVPRDDPQALAAAIRRLQGDPALRQRLGAAGQARAAAAFSERQAMRELLQFYQNLLDS